MSEKLALFGAPATLMSLPKRYNPIGEEERKAVDGVMRTGVLSEFLGTWHKNFFGGENVLALEKMVAEYFGVEYAVSVNSWTSGLIAAVGAIDINPGDEVIVSPWTMSATAVAPLWWNAIPVFADIDNKTFTLDPGSVEANITPYTKAIISVDIFGHSADMDALRLLAHRHGLQIISDSAQAPNALYKGQYAGTLGDIGGYSLNYHKHIHSGEGGLLVTNDSLLAERLQLIRNHAESVVAGKSVSNIANMIGGNFRLGELEAAIAVSQLTKLDLATQRMQEVAELLNLGLEKLPGIQTPVVKPGCSHVYYAYALVFDVQALAVSRDRLVDALYAEGVPLGRGYENLHLLPMFQKKIAYGKRGFPWTSPEYRGDVTYTKGICPVAEELHDHTLTIFPLSLYDWSNTDIEMVIEAFEKVWEHLDRLR